MGCSSPKMMTGIPDEFSKNFDYILTGMGLIQNNKSIESESKRAITIYIKTDFLNFFVKQIMPQIKIDFVLISACSDYSPEINFNSEYQAIVSNPFLKHWYMNNMRNYNEKTSSLPCGLSSTPFTMNESGMCLDSHFEKGFTEDHLDRMLLSIRSEVDVEKKIDKVFCAFRNRDFNICGEDMIIRPRLLEIIKGRDDIFDFYTEPMGYEEYVRTLSKYKHSICPHGNGMDPNPSAMLSMLVYTTPVVYSTPNSRSMFKDTDSVIFFDELEQASDISIYKNVPYADFEWMTAKYWAKKIIDKANS